jgi:hypothetical protein
MLWRCWYHACMATLFSFSLHWVFTAYPIRYAFSLDGSTTQLPAEDLCLWDGHVILMDTGVQLLLWSGANTYNNAGDECRARALDMCLALCDIREPSPLLLCSRSGDGQQRWLEAQVKSKMMTKQNNKRNLQNKHKHTHTHTHSSWLLLIVTVLPVMCPNSHTC